MKKFYSIQYVNVKVQNIVLRSVTFFFYIISYVFLYFDLSTKSYINVM